MFKFKRRIVLAGAAVSVLVAAGLVGFVGVGGAGAAAHTAATTHTLQFIAVKESASQPNKSGAYYQSDVDVRAATETSPGGTIAQDVLSCVGTPTSLSCSVALADNKGILYGNFAANFKNGGVRGTVTGGPGAYSGATGIVTGKPSATGESITVTYNT
jgi:hypothetical protein